MSNQPVPRYVTSALIEEEGGSITVTWGLGDVIRGEVEYFGYGIDYYGVDGNGGKRFGVKFHDEATAHVFEWSSVTEANYTSANISYTNERIVVFYPDASIGLDEVGTIQAFSHVNGTDVQTGLPVTLMR